MKYGTLKITIIIFLLLFHTKITGQIIDTIDVEYEIVDGDDYSIEIATLQLNINSNSYPIIGCYDNGDPVPALCILNVNLERKGSLSENMEIKKVEIMFIGLADTLKGSLNSYCMFEHGSPPKNMPIKHQEKLFFLKSKIIEFVMNWDCKIVNSRKPLPDKIDLQIPFHCVLILEQNLCDFFVPLR